MNFGISLRCFIKILLTEILVEIFIELILIEENEIFSILEISIIEGDILTIE